MGDVEIWEERLATGRREIFQAVVDGGAEALGIDRLLGEVWIFTRIDFAQGHHSRRQRLAKVDRPCEGRRRLRLAADEPKRDGEGKSRKKPMG